MDKLRVGIIGCGTILPVHLDSIHSIKEVELSVVCDIDERRAKAVAKLEGCRYETDYKKVLQDKSIDVVHILTPHFLHTPMAIEALEHHKHIVLEKPVGISLQELKQLKEKADQSDLTIGVTLQNRFNPTTMKMKEIVESNILGKFLAAKGILTWCRKDEYYSDSNWRGKLATEGGGLLINQAIHTLDLLEYVGGPVKDLQAHVSNFTHPDIEVEDTAMIYMNYESGAVASFYGTNSYGSNSEIEMGFVYEKGELLLRDKQLYLIENGNSTILANDIVKKGDKSYWGMSHQYIIQDIYKAILSNGKPMVRLDHGIRATELVLLSYRSYV